MKGLYGERSRNGDGPAARFESIGDGCPDVRRGRQMGSFARRMVFEPDKPHLLADTVLRR
jgi:hypothetical protein